MNALVKGILSAAVVIIIAMFGIPVGLHFGAMDAAAAANYTIACIAGLVYCTFLLLILR